MRWEAPEPLCPGPAALDFSGLKSHNEMPGSAVSVCIPWRTVLLGSSLGKQLSKRMSDSVKYFTEHLGLDGLTHHDDVKFLFLLGKSTWACPWSAGARVGAVNTLGPMADDDSAVPAWLRWDKALLAHIWAGPPLRGAQWVVFPFLCRSYSCRFAVISRGFETGLSWLS